MKIENQVTSLEISKKLKELGVKQESLFYWIENSNGTDSMLRFVQEGVYPKILSFSAFTVAELGEMLPAEVTIKNSKYKEYSLRIEKTLNGKWFVGYGTEEITEIEENGANAFGKMLIYLLENNLLSIKD